MQKAPVLKGSGLQPLKETTEEVHVFGRNLEDRVVTNDQEDGQQQQEPQSSDLNSPQNDEDVDIRKRKFEAITGEEEEKTIFQADFKLYVWDLESSNWIEKGRGQLKLNDSLVPDCPESRLIMRISGTLKIILNVAIRKNFRIISSSKTNLRFTDGQNMWAVSGGTADKLAGLIEPRVEKVKLASKEDGDVVKGVKKTKKDEEQDKEPAENVDARKNEEKEDVSPKADTSSHVQLDSKDHTEVSENELPKRPTSPQNLSQTDDDSDKSSKQEESEHASSSESGEEESSVREQKKKAGQKSEEAAKETGSND